MNGRGIPFLLLLPGLAVAATLSAHTRQTSQSRERLSRPAVKLQLARPGGLAGLYGKLPLSFEANRGQTDSRVKFLTRGPGYTLFLTPGEAVLALEQSPAQGKPGPRVPRGTLASQKPVVTALRIELAGGNPDAPLSGLDELPGKSNYLIGNDPAKWRTNVPTYGRVQLRGVYPGIDLVYYGRQRELEEDFLVAPGADPRTITLGITGARKIFINDEGELVLEIARGEVRLRKPVVYQQAADARREIASGYRLEAENRVGFKLGPYDPSQPLVIDPTLAYSTYLGGSGDDEGYGIAIDSSGNAYVTGSTTSTDFPGTSSSTVQPSYGGGSEDAFVTKLSADGSALVYSTYLGGTGADQGNGIAVDSSGNAYITGFTASSDFPGANLSGIQSSFSGSQQAAFAAKISADGRTLVYSTYLGGSFVDAGNGIAVDSSGNAYVTGFTESLGFPGTGSSTIQSSLNGFENAFVAEINAAGSALVYSTYLGGEFFDGGYAIAVDSTGNAYLTGFTSSFDFPGVTANSLQPSLNGFENAFVAEINTGGSALVYSTYLGGDAFDAGKGIAVDSSGNAYVTGFTSSDNFPTAGSPYQSSLAGLQNAFVAKVNAGGGTLDYSTYLGGNGTDEGKAIAVDSAGNAYVTGSTTSNPFPGTPTSTIQSAFGGGTSDAFVAEVNAAGSGLVYSTYLGGSSRDIGYGIAVDSAGTAYIAGFTGSPDFRTTTGAFQRSLDGSEDVFVVKIVQVVPFSSFSAKLTIYAGPPESFALNSTFTLGFGGSINPLTDPITLQVGTYSATILPGSFSQLTGGSKAGSYVFSGVVNGASLAIQIVPLGGSSYQFKATGQPVNLTMSNPVTVAITIGNNAGTMGATASFQ
jgi:Beta-propeller repeat